MFNRLNAKSLIVLLLSVALSGQLEISARRTGSGWTSEVNDRNADMTVSGRTTYYGGGSTLSLSDPTRSEYFRWYQLDEDAEMYKDYYFDFSPANNSFVSQSLINRFFQRGGAGMGFAVSHSDSENKDYIYVIGAGGNGNSSTVSSGTNTIYYYDVATGTESSFTIPRNTDVFNDPYGNIGGSQLTRRYNNAGYVNYCIFNDEHGNILIAQCDNSYNLKAFLVLPRGFTRSRDCDSSGAAQHFLRFALEPDDINYNATAKTTWATNNPRLNILSHLDVRHLEFRGFHDCWDQIGYVYITIPGQAWFYRLRLNGQDSDETTPTSTTPKWYSPGDDWNDKKWYVQLSDIEQHHSDSNPTDDVENVYFYYYNAYWTPATMRPSNGSTFTNACTITPYASNRLFVQLCNGGCYWVESIFKGGTVGQSANSKIYNPNGNASSPALKKDGSTLVAENTYTFTYNNKVTNSYLRYTTPGATAFLMQGGAFAVYPKSGGSHDRGIRIEAKTDNEMFDSSGDLAYFDAELLPSSTRKQNFAGYDNAGSDVANLANTVNTYTISPPTSYLTSYSGMAWYTTTSYSESSGNHTWTGNIGNNAMASTLVPGVYSQVLRVDYRTVDVYFFARNVGVGKVRLTTTPKPLNTPRGYGHFAGRHRIQWNCPGTRGCYGYRIEVKVGTGSYTTLYGSTDANLWTPVAHNSVNSAGSKTYADVTFDDSNSSRLGKSCTYRITPVYKTMGWNGESVDWAYFILEDGPSIEIPVTVPTLPTPTTSLSISTLTGATTDNPGSDLKQVDASLTVTRPSGTLDAGLSTPTYYQRQVSKVSEFGSTIVSSYATISGTSATYTKSNISALGNLDVTSSTTGTNTITKKFTYYSRARARYDYNPGDSTEQVWGGYGTVASNTLSLTYTAPTITAYNFVDAARRVEEWWGSGASGHKVTQYYDVYRIGLQIANISGNSVQPSYYTLQRRQSSSSAWENVTDCTYEYLCGTGSQATYPSISGYTAGRYKGNYTFSSNRYTMTVDGNSRSVNLDYFYWFNVTSAHTNSATDPSQSNPNQWQYRIVANYASSNSKLKATLEGPASATATPVVTGVDLTVPTKEIRDTKYYNLQGLELREMPSAGAFIEVKLYTDGSVSTVKRVAR